MKTVVFLIFAFLFIDTIAQSENHYDGMALIPSGEFIMGKDMNKAVLPKARLFPFREIIKLEKQLFEIKRFAQVTYKVG